MRKKNKNNNENAQMQDMNTVQMDGANAAFAMWNILKVII